ncbi:MAG: hypothetical protein DMF84_10370 [Acidobacteria bacterium]|nr:MAG: hypothetical protein DMF84_10370 [Acidobacteriota bacterium]
MMHREPSAATLDNPRHHPTTILSSRSQIARLDEPVDRLMPQRDVTVTPSFFLASLADNWLPRVAVVHRDNATAGVIYGKERTIAGFRTGLIYADGRLGNLAVAKPIDCKDVMRAAVRAWFELPRVRGVRLLISPTGQEARALATVRSTMPIDLTHSAAAPTELHSRLLLPVTYEHFLNSLGKKTRRNFRYYRRRFEAAGHTYFEHLSYEEFDRAATDLRTKCHLSSSVSEIRRAVRTVKSADDTWIAGLKHANGEWLSVSAGWSAPGRATMFLQLNNDKQFGDASLSVVLRAFLIETFIRRGISELVFWSGSAPPLSRYVQPIPAIAVHLDAPTIGWRFIRGVIGSTEPLIGRWITPDVRWMIGTGRSSEPLDAGGTESPSATSQQHPPAGIGRSHTDANERSE